MFENILNELKNLKCYNYKIDIPVDEEGYIDKERPNQECLYQFKIFHYHIKPGEIQNLTQAEVCFKQ